MNPGVPPEGPPPDPYPPYSSAPMHPAPEERWRPLSGLALTAFLASLVLALVAALGLWVVLALPFFLGLLAWTTVSPALRRGRVLAVWAMVISALAGSCSYLVHKQGREQMRTVASGVLGALKGGDPERLRDWLDPEAKEAPEVLRRRFDAVVAQAGEWTGEVEMGGAFTGLLAAFLPPKGLADLVEVEPEPQARRLQPGEAIWAKARFARETVHLALIFGEGGAEGLEDVRKRMRPGGTSPVVGDVRFFRPAPAAPASSPDR